MSYFEERFLEEALSIENAHAKALTNFLFREVIEDAHVKYNISQDDVKEMCKNSVNRAAFFLDKVVNDPKLYKVFTILAVGLEEWDNPKETEYTQKLLKLLQEFSEYI